jgi:predicted outer membrane repeat protein
MRIEDSQVEMEGCNFQGSRNYESAFVFRGWIWSEDSTLSVTDCHFVDNSNRRDSFSTITIDQGKALFKKCFFSDHKRNVIDAGAANLSIEQCKFVNNKGGGSGAIELNNCKNVQIITSLFLGGLGYRGGAIGGEANFTFVINQCTFSGNLATREGGAIRCPNAIITNCIFWNNRAPFYVDVYSNNPNYLHHNSFESIGSVTFSDSNLLQNLGSNGNIFGDPFFIDPGYWDDSGTPDDPNDDIFMSGDYHLKSQAGRWDPNSATWVMDYHTSPCIDAGDPNTPVGQEPLPNGNRVNMGAYGGTAEASLSYSN